MRRHFTMTIPAELAPALERVMASEGYTSEPALVSALLRRALAAVPEKADVMSVRAQAYNDVRKQVVRAAAAAMGEIRRMLDRELEMTNEDQSRSAQGEDGAVQPQRGEGGA